MNGGALLPNFRGGQRVFTTQSASLPHSRAFYGCNGFQCGYICIYMYVSNMCFLTILVDFGSILYVAFYIPPLTYYGRFSFHLRCSILKSFTLKLCFQASSNNYINKFHFKILFSNFIQQLH